MWEIVFILVSLPMLRRGTVHTILPFPLQAGRQQSPVQVGHP